MDAVVVSAIAGQLANETSDLLKQQVGPLLKKHKAEKTDQDTKEMLQQVLQRGHQNERYYNALDGYLTRTKIADGLLLSLRGENDFQPILREDFINKHLQAFYAYGDNSQFASKPVDGYRLREAFGTVYDLIFQNVTAINPFSEAGKLAIRMNSKIDESTNVLNRELGEIKELLKERSVIVPTLVRENIEPFEDSSSSEAEILLSKTQKVETNFQLKAKYRDAIDEYLSLMTEMTAHYVHMSKVETDQISSHLQENIAICYANLGEVKRAEQYIRKIQGIRGFENRQSAQYLSAAVEVYYHEAPDYTGALKYVERAIEIAPDYRKAILLRALILSRLKPETIDTILQEIDVAFAQGEVVPKEQLGEYYLHKGVILREAGQLDEAIFFYREALNHGMDETIVLFNMAVTHYGKAIQANSCEKRIICPQIDFPELLEAYKILKGLIQKEGKADDRNNTAVLELLINVCGLLGKTIAEEIPKEILQKANLSPEAKRVIILSSSEPLSQKEISLLPDADQHFVRMRDNLNGNQPKKCIEYWQALKTVGFSMTAPVMNLALQASLILKDFTLFSEQRELALEAGVSDRLISIYDAKAAAEQGKTEDACAIYDTIIEKENDYELLDKAIGFYRENGYNDKAVAFYSRIAERHRSGEVFISNPNSFYFEAIAFLKEHAPAVAREIFSWINPEMVSELQYCHIRVMAYEKYHDFKEIADASRRAFEIQESYEDGLNAVIAMTALMQYEEAFSVADKLPGLALDDEDRTRAYLVLSDLSLLLQNQDDSQEWSRKAHELNIEKPSHLSHQAYAARCLRCNNIEALKEILQYKQFHPNAVQWIQIVMESEAQSKGLQEALEKALGVNGQEYSWAETKWIMKYKEGKIPLHTLFRFYHGNVRNLIAYLQRHKLRISGGSLAEVREQASLIQNVVVSDAYTLIVLALCDCLNVLEKPDKIFLPAASINLIQQCFLTEETRAVSDIIEFLRSASNVKILPDGIYEKSPADRILAQDVDICLHISEEKNIPYLSCESLLAELLKEPDLSMPRANYVSIVAVAEKYLKEEPALRAATKWKLLKKCDFVNFNAMDVLKSIELANWTVSAEIVSPFLNFKSTCDSASFARVYAGVTAALYKKGGDIQKQFLELLVDNMEKAWHRGQTLRNPIRRDAANKARAQAIDAFVVQNAGLIFGMKEQGLIELAEEQRERIVTLVAKVIRTQKYDQEKWQSFLKAIYEETDVEDRGPSEKKREMTG